MAARPDSQPTPVSDDVLLTRLAKRDSTALVELERRHRSALYAQAYGVLMDAAAADRVVHDAFAELWFSAGANTNEGSAWSLLRDMARELARAEQALRDSKAKGR
jgi:hypothetical protein